MIHVSGAVVNTLNFLDTQTLSPATEWFTTIDNNQLADESYVKSEVDTNTFGFGDFIKGIFYFVVAVGGGIIYVPYTLSSFGLQAPFVYYFSVPVYMLYFLALAQFIANRSTTVMS
jgi:hypothetical protein